MCRLYNRCALAPGFPLPSVVCLSLILLSVCTQALPALSASCTSFSQAAERIASSRAHNRQLLQHHGCVRPLLRVPQPALLDRYLTRTHTRALRRTLVDLLEVGSLLDTCVRTGAFDEALDLDALCAKLAAAAPGVPVAARLAKEASAGVAALLAQLLTRLRGPVQLPECLRLVGYRRRLGAFTEHELRLTFLRCRDAWLSTCIADLSTEFSAAAHTGQQGGVPGASSGGSAYEHAKRLTDIHRTHLFDCIMQFRAVFADDAPTTGSSNSILPPRPSSSTSGIAWHDAAAAAAAAMVQVGEPRVRGSALVHAWASYRVATFLELLSATLDRLTEGAALAGVMEQCGYCGASLGRVGLDFRPLIQPLVCTPAQRVVTTALSHALDGFHRSLASHRWGAAAAATAGQQTLGGSTAPDDGSGGPPTGLMAHPPVAVLLNGILAALNELRHVPLPPLRLPLAAALHDTLRSAASDLVRAHRSMDPGDASAAACRAMAAALADVAAPYAAACFGRIYPGGAALVDAIGAVEVAHTLATLVK